MKTGVLIIFFVAFVDNYVFINDHFNDAVFYLYPIVLSILGKRSYNDPSFYRDTCLSTPRFIVSITVDLVWSLLSNLYVYNIFFPILNQDRVLPLLSVFILCVHMVSSCFNIVFFEFFIRSFFFYSICMVVYHSPFFVEMINGHRHHRGQQEHQNMITSSTFDKRQPLYTCLHILFVNNFVMVLSIFCLLFIYFNIYYKNCQMQIQIGKMDGEIKKGKFNSEIFPINPMGRSSKSSSSVSGGEQIQNINHVTNIQSLQAFYIDCDGDVVNRKEVVSTGLNTPALNNLRDDEKTSMFSKAGLGFKSDKANNIDDGNNGNNDDLLRAFQEAKRNSQTSDGVAKLEVLVS